MKKQSAHTTGRIRARLACAASGLLVVGAVAACTPPAAPTDRAGGDTTVLHLATADGPGVDPDTYQGPSEFVAALEEVSGGRLKVDLTWDHAAGAADAETQLVEAIASGEVDGGWPPTRAFGRAGIEGLEAVEAPMLLTSEAAVEELVGGEYAEEVLAQLDGTGMTGVGLMAAPLRRPVSGEKPFVAPQDWKNATFRVYNSPVQAAAVRALGGRPVDMAFAWADALRVGDLDGAELDVAVDLPTAVHNVTGNVVLWPKVFVAAFNTDTFAALTDEQKGWIREAADRATTASIEAQYDGSFDLQSYCDRGDLLHQATKAELAELRAALSPVLDDLRNDPETGELMQTVDELARSYPDTDVVSPTGGCDGDDAPDSGDGVPTTTAPIPEGTYRAEIPVEATAEVGNDGGFSGTWTLRVQDGTYALSCRPLELPGTDCGHTNTTDVLNAGFLKGNEDTVWFVTDAPLMAELSGCELPPTADDPDACFVLPPDEASWRENGDRLAFSDATEQTLNLGQWERVAN
jgi:TRAP-type C4-dicarboxylate transport system substrate-binding protein